MYRESGSLKSCNGAERRRARRAGVSHAMKRLNVAVRRPTRPTGRLRRRLMRARCALCTQKQGQLLSLLLSFSTPFPPFFSRHFRRVPVMPGGNATLSDDLLILFIPPLFLLPARRVPVMPGGAVARSCRVPCDCAAETQWNAILLNDPRRDCPTARCRAETSGIICSISQN